MGDEAIPEAVLPEGSSESRSFQDLASSYEAQGRGAPRESGERRVPKWMRGTR